MVTRLPLEQKIEGPNPSSPTIKDAAGSNWTWRESNNYENINFRLKDLSAIASAQEENRPLILTG